MKSKVSFGIYMKALKNTSTFMNIAKGLYHKHIRSEFDYIRNDGKASAPPIQISLRITNACNHRCAVCGQYGHTGYMKNTTGKHLSNNLQASHFMRMIDEVAFYKPILYVTGGEPFMYPRIMEVMNYAKRKGLTVSIVTNGVKLAQHSEEIVKSKWDMVMVSLDGPKEIHDRCRNLKGAFDTATDGIKKLQEAKTRHKSSLPFILTSTTLSTVNANVLNECFEIGKNIMPDAMIIYLSWFTNKDIGQRQQRILKKELNFEPFTWKSYVREFTPSQAKEIADAIIRVKKKNWPFDYQIIPDVGEKNYAKYYLETDNLFGYSRCAAPFIMVDVMPNGDVTTCRDFVDIKVGNITENPLLKIWNNEPFVKFRKMLLKNKGTLPQCSRCCGLMGF